MQVARQCDFHVRAGELASIPRVEDHSVLRIAGAAAAVAKKACPATITAPLNREPGRAELLEFFVPHPGVDIPDASLLESYKPLARKQITECVHGDHVVTGAAHTVRCAAFQSPPGIENG
jgi:hypothetical protein